MTSGGVFANIIYVVLDDFFIASSDIVPEWLMG
jgi:hypothetical protein